MFCFSIFVVCFVCYVLEKDIDGFDVVSSRTCTVRSVERSRDKNF